MKLKLLIIAMVAMMTASCSTIRHSSSTADVENNIVTFTVADLNVKPTKVEKTYSWSFNPFKRVSVENVKTNITAEVINENNADVLLEPQYIVSKRGFLRGGSVTVYGIPAKYTNFHKMTPEEAAIVRDAFPKDKKDHKKRWFIF